MTRDFIEERILKYKQAEHSLVVHHYDNGDVQISLQYLGVKSETHTLLLEEDQWCVLHDMLGEISP
jgi:hypothetical protein